MDVVCSSLTRSGLALSTICLAAARMKTWTLAGVPLLAVGVGLSNAGPTEARCVEDVERQFAALGDLPTGGNEWPQPTGQAAFRYPAGQSLRGHSGPFPALDTGEGHGHVQGFSRIPGLSGGTWFVFSRSNKKGPAGIVFARLSEQPRQAAHARLSEQPRQRADARLSEQPRQRADARLSEQPRRAADGPILGESIGTPPPGDQSLRLFVEIPGTKHPGGLQVMGQIIAVPAWCNDHDICEDAMIKFFLVEECASEPGICVQQVNQFEQGDGGHPWFVDGDKVNFLAAARMRSGHYILVLNRNDLGHATIMVSDETQIDETTQWIRLETDRYSKNYDNGGDTYQNFNLVRECGTEKLYAIGLSQQGWKGENQVDLFDARIDVESREFDIDRVRRIRLGNPGRESGRRSGSCEMKGGAGVYVSASGRLIIYCSQGKHLSEDSKNLLLFSEFAAPN